MKTKLSNGKLATAAEWFASGTRNIYSLKDKELIEPSKPSYGQLGHVHVFSKVNNKESNETNWISFLPGFPDGSFGWSRVDQELHEIGISNPQLFVEYIGQGDSDKPEDYAYSTYERADLVEAQWKANEIKETFLVTFDYSSLVAMELLCRQEERSVLNNQLKTKISGVLMINGGLFADAHSHPLMTTPLLKTAIGKMGARMAGKNRKVFDLMMKGLWSPEYGVSQAELGEVFDAISRRNGAVFMSNAARFVDEHKQNAKRWDLARLYHALSLAVKFYVVGSEQDPFEYKQIDAAKKRLAAQGLSVRKVPGGHMTTSEQPQQLADIIVEVINRQARPGASGAENY
ncbi:MAG: alpha/beta hydrolase [Cytophagales bacterium]|nr:alpha/beta hydrolase [Cytophagales bacterium]